MIQSKPFVEVYDLGRIRYQEALEIQRFLMKKLIDIKLANRSKEKKDWTIPRHYFLFCEHEPVFTLGRTGNENHLLLNKAQLTQQSIEYYKTNRGGDITYHGPGQIVGYPIFDLEYFFTDVHKYVRFIEEAIIRTLSDFNIEGNRVQDYTGVWLDAKGQLLQRKICAIGIHLSRWVSMHGFALNVNTDLSYFDKIIPCGISAADMQVTSMQREVNNMLSMRETHAHLLRHFAQVFNFEYAQMNTEDLLELNNDEN